MMTATKKGPAATDPQTLESIHSTTSISYSSAVRPLMDERSSLARVRLNTGLDSRRVAAEESKRVDVMRRLKELKRVFLAQRGEESCPATMGDVIVDRGEFWGDGVPRTAGWHPYEPLTGWDALRRVA